MDNKIDIRFIKKQIEMDNNINNISDKISSINLKQITENIQNNIKIAKKEIEEILKELKISTENNSDNLEETKNRKTILKDKNYIDKTTYEYRSKHLKRKLVDTGFYSILGKYHKYR
jgi:ElaB/YqjD/DUF883 family membrane-anchored ribosome-binding protein